MYGIFADITTQGIEPSDLLGTLIRYGFNVFQIKNVERGRQCNVEFNRVLAEVDIGMRTTSNIFQVYHNVILEDLKKINKDVVLRTQWICQDDIDYEESFGYD